MYTFNKGGVEINTVHVREGDLGDCKEEWRFNLWYLGDCLIEVSTRREPKSLEEFTISCLADELGELLGST